MGAVARLEKVGREKFERAVTVSDDFDVSRTSTPDAVIVFDGEKVVRYDDPTVFRKEKILITAEVNVVDAIGPIPNDAEARRITDWIRDGGAAQAFVRVHEADDPVVALVVTMGLAAGLPPDGTMLVTDRSFCPDPLPPGGRELKAG